LPRPEIYRNLRIKDNVKIDPCMGSGHILVYAFDVLMFGEWNDYGRLPDD
jgi:hypothetical protein